MNFIERIDERIDLNLLTKAFLALAAASLCLVPGDGLIIFLQKAKSSQPAAARHAVVSKSIETQSSYSEVFDRSALFGGVVSGASGQVMMASMAELTKDYRLKGVVLTDEPEAIVEDAKTQKTIFVKKGDPLGEVTVKDIKDGCIVLAYLNQEAKLEIQ